MTTASFGWAAALRPGMIVSFNFPLGEGEGRAKARPCLVIGTSAGDDGTPLVTLAYGTSADSHANRGLDLDLAEPDDWQAAGLHRATRFVLARRVTVPARDVRFNAHRRGNPVIGVLPASSMSTLHRLTSFLGATISEHRPRGSIGIRPTEGRDARGQQRSRGRREPTVVRVRRKRYCQAATGAAPRLASTLPAFARQPRVATGQPDRGAGSPAPVSAGC